MKMRLDIVLLAQSFLPRHVNAILTLLTFKVTCNSSLSAAQVGRLANNVMAWIVLLSMPPIRANAEYGRSPETKTPSHDLWRQICNQDCSAYASTFLNFSRFEMNQSGERDVQSRWRTSGCPLLFRCP